MTEPQPVDAKRILFVDDDLHLLEGLRDALRPFRRQWAMSFVTSGDEALSLLAEQKQDVVSSDLRMPGMDGATLLARVLESHPTAVRIIRPRSESCSPGRPCSGPSRERRAWRTGYLPSHAKSTS